MKNRVNLMMLCGVAAATLLVVEDAASAEVDDGTATGGNETAAVEKFNEGTQLFHDRDYDGAAAAFRSAHALRPNWKLLYNIGQSDAAAKRYGPALEAFEKYLVMGGDDIETGRRDEVLEEIGKFRKIVGAVEIQGDKDLVITVDDLERGTTPLSGPVLVAAGIEHRFRALRNGEVVFEQTLRVTGEEKTLLRIPEQTTVPTPEPVEAAAPTDEKIPPAPAAPKGDGDTPGRSLKAAGWATLGVGAAVLVAGAVTGGMSLSLENELAPDCAENGCPPGKTSDRDRMDQFALATDVLIGAGAAVAATGIVLLVLGIHKNKTSVETTTVKVAPCLSPQLASVSFVKEF